MFSIELKFNVKNLPFTNAFMPFLVPGTINVCVRLYEKPTKIE